MKISKSFEFYWSILENASFFGNIGALRNVDNWEWDSRAVNSGSLFLAFKGQNRDAFDFVLDVLAKGSRVIVTLTEHQAQVEELLKSNPDALFILEEPLAFLKRSAEAMLATMPDLLKIGITGSNGKTTTKEILASVLKASDRPFYASEGNYNSDIGMGLSILQLTGHEEVAVFEMGINGEGDMDTLVDLLRPQLAVVTHLSHAHVGPLGGFEGVVREKSKIARYADVLFCPQPEALLIQQTGGVNSRLITYSLEDGELQRERSSFQGEYLKWGGQELFLSIAGSGALLATRAVIEISKYLGLEPSALKEGLAEVRLPYGRMQLVETLAHVDFLHDAYNANLSSLGILLDFIKTNQAISLEYCRTFVIFAGFKELGEETKEAHKTALDAILSLSWNTVFLVGEDLKELADSLGSSHPIQYFRDMEHALTFFSDFFKAKDFVVLKGARYYALERIINLFQGDKEK